MNRYDTLKKLEGFNLLISLGIIPINIMDWLLIYEFYKSERECLGKMQSYSNTAEYFHLSETHVRYVVSWMQGF